MATKLGKKCNALTHIYTYIKILLVSFSLQRHNAESQLFCLFTNRQRYRVFDLNVIRLFNWMQSWNWHGVTALFRDVCSLCIFRINSEVNLVFICFLPSVSCLTGIAWALSRVWCYSPVSLCLPHVNPKNTSRRNYAVPPSRTFKLAVPTTAMLSPCQTGRSRLHPKTFFL